MRACARACLCVCVCACVRLCACVRACVRAPAVRLCVRASLPTVRESAVRSLRECGRRHLMAGEAVAVSEAERVEEPLSLAERGFMCV
jgi:hypothetical protein